MPSSRHERPRRIVAGCPVYPAGTTGDDSCKETKRLQIRHEGHFSEYSKRVDGPASLLPCGRPRDTRG